VAFAKRIIRHQPLTYLKATGSDFVRAFAPTRSRHDGEPPVGQWQFPTAKPVFVEGLVCSPDRDDTLERRRRCKAVERRIERIIKDHGGAGTRISPSLPSFLNRYQTVGYTPGPLLAVALVLGFAAALGFGRARKSGLRAAAFLFSSVGACAVLTSWPRSCSRGATSYPSSSFFRRPPRSGSRPSPGGAISTRTRVLSASPATPKRLGRASLRVW
jgi:hypothetical protein